MNTCIRPSSPEPVPGDTNLHNMAPIEGAAAKMLRRSHKKSRRGCLECKRRHIKVCDGPIYHGSLCGGSRGVAAPWLDSRVRVGPGRCCLPGRRACTTYIQARTGAGNLRLNLPPPAVRRDPTKLSELRNSRTHVLVPSKRRCFAPEPEVPCEHLSNNMPDGNFGPLAAASCSGGQSRAGRRSRRTKADSVCSERLGRGRPKRQYGAPRAVPPLFATALQQLLLLSCDSRNGGRH